MLTLTDNPNFFYVNWHSIGTSIYFLNFFSFHSSLFLIRCIHQFFRSPVSFHSISIILWFLLRIFFVPPLVSWSSDEGIPFLHLISDVVFTFSSQGLLISSKLSINSSVHSFFFVLFGVCCYFLWVLGFLLKI